MSGHRWHAAITYRVTAGWAGSGSVMVEHDLAEIADLHQLVERGPHWDTIIKIVVTRVNHNTSKMLTIEEASRLAARRRT